MICAYIHFTFNGLTKESKRARDEATERTSNQTYTCNFSQALTFMLLSNIILSLTQADYIKSTVKFVYSLSCWYCCCCGISHLHRALSQIRKANHSFLDLLHWHEVKHTQYTKRLMILFGFSSLLFWRRFYTIFNEENLISRIYFII